jgi:hypothetical protein
MIEIAYEVGASEAGLRELFAAEVDDEALVEAHGEPWLDRGLEAPRRTVKQLRAEAWRSFRTDAAAPATERVLSLREAAPWLDLSARQLRHDVDEGRYDEALTLTRDGLRALRFADTVRTWRLPRARPPDPRVLVAMTQARVQPGEEYVWQIAGETKTRTYVRRSDGECWRERW